MHSPSLITCFTELHFCAYQNKLLHKIKQSLVQGWPLHCYSAKHFLISAHWSLSHDSHPSHSPFTPNLRASTSLTIRSHPSQLCRVRMGPWKSWILQISLEKSGFLLWSIKYCWSRLLWRITATNGNANAQKYVHTGQWAFNCGRHHCFIGRVNILMLT